MSESISTISGYVLPAVAAFGLSVVFTILVRALANRFRIHDAPGSAIERKIHARPTPLLGGSAIVGAFLIVVAIISLSTDRLLGGYLLPKHLIGIAAGSIMLMVGGFLDDRFRLRASQQIIWPILASLAVIASGIGVSYIQNPFGGDLRLDQWAVSLFTLEGIPYRVVFLADAFAFIWLMGMMYTTKFLDGLDGLVSGVTTIGAFVIFFLSIGSEVAQPETALLAIILAGAATGFLVFNFYPAKIFLGEGGSLWTGFILGTLAIISGAKIATALLILGIPILDVAWVILRRVFQRQPVAQADRQHLHFRLLDVGLSHRQAVLFLYVMTAVFGITALAFQGRGKLIALLILLSVMLMLGIIVVIAYKKKGHHS